VFYLEITVNCVPNAKIGTPSPSPLEKRGVVAFSEVHVVPDLETGILGIAQANGIAGLASNTVVFGWSEEREGLAKCHGTPNAPG